MCFSIHTYVLNAVVVVSTRYKKNTFPRTYMIPTNFLYQWTINYYPVRGRNLAKTTKYLPWISNYSYFVQKSVSITYCRSRGTRKIWFEPQGNCEYLRQAPTTTPTVTMDTNYQVSGTRYYITDCTYRTDRRHLQSKVFTRAAIQYLPWYILTCWSKNENFSWRSPCSN